MVDFSMKQIGWIESCYPDKFGTPRQPGLNPSSTAKIHLDKEWQPASSLEGLSEYSHLWILFVFHLNTNKIFHAKVHPPRLGGQAMGVFATRSPHRPNPIGLSVVKIEKIEEGVIYISGIDIVHGTPVLDIKPYIPEVEALNQAHSGWSGKAGLPRFQVEWTQEQLQCVEVWARRISQAHLRQLIEETLIQDPRPIVYRGFEGQESPYRESHAVRIYDGDIHFKFLENQKIQITKILF